MDSRSDACLTFMAQALLEPQFGFDWRDSDAHYLEGIWNPSDAHTRWESMDSLVTTFTNTHSTPHQARDEHPADRPRAVSLSPAIRHYLWKTTWQSRVAPG